MSDIYCSPLVPWRKSARRLPGRPAGLLLDGSLEWTRWGSSERGGALSGARWRRRREGELRGRAEGAKNAPMSTRSGAHGSFGDDGGGWSGPQYPWCDTAGEPGRARQAKGDLSGLPTSASGLTTAATAGEGACVLDFECSRKVHLRYGMRGRQKDSNWGSSVWPLPLTGELALAT